MTHHHIDEAGRKAIDRRAKRRAQVAMEAAMELMVERFGVAETIRRINMELEHLKEFGR